MLERSCKIITLTLQVCQSKFKFPSVIYCCYNIAIFEHLTSPLHQTHSIYNTYYSFIVILSINAYPLTAKIPSDLLLINHSIHIKLLLSDFLSKTNPWLVQNSQLQTSMIDFPGCVYGQLMPWGYKLFKFLLNGVHFCCSYHRDLLLLVSQLWDTLVMSIAD